MKHITHSTVTKSQSDVSRTWHLIDAKGEVLGRMSSRIATYLQGKHKPTYSANIDSGDYVVVINAKQIGLTGKKEAQKEYTYYSGYPGGLKRVSYTHMMDRNPSEIIRHAVMGQLPKNKLRSPRIARLYIFANETHPYTDKFS